jgi:hypothetical protein
VTRTTPRILFAERRDRNEGLSGARAVQESSGGVFENINVQREIQTALVPEGLAFDPELFYFCPPNSSLIQFLTDTLEFLGLVGVPDGI